MTAKSKNPTIGKIVCDGCGGSAEVCQTSRGAGRYLYTRCVDCGTDQRTGKAVQNRLWTQTEWFDGEPDIKPPNVDAAGVAPVVEAVAEPEKEQEPEPKKVVVESKDSDDESGLVWLFGGAVALAALVLRG